MDSILKKVSEGDTRKKIQLLTLVPQSCSHRTIAHFIGVLGYTVSESRELFRKSGILGYIEYKYLVIRIQRSIGLQKMIEKVGIVMRS